MFKRLLCLIAILFCICNVNISNATIVFQPDYMDGFMVAEDVTNFSGGLKSGSVFNGVVHSIANYKLAQNQYHPVLRVGVLAITYTQPQGNYTNASQSVSNLTAQGMIRLAELNYYQDINAAVNFRVGIMDLREYFNCYDVPKELINSGFGTNRVMNSGVNLSTYPYPGFGAIVNLQHNNFGLGVAVFQGDPQHQSTVFKRGVFVLEEIDWQTDLNMSTKPTLYLKLGSWQYNQPDPTIGFSNVGLYVMAQAVWLDAASRQISTYAQFGYSDKLLNQIPYSAHFGCSITGLFPNRDADVLSFGISEIWLRSLPNEIVFETNYAFKFYNYFLLKPDLQYIIRPSGVSKNAFAGIIRLIYNIDGHLLAKH